MLNLLLPLTDAETARRVLHTLTSQSQETSRQCATIFQDQNIEKIKKTLKNMKLGVMIFYVQHVVKAHHSTGYGDHERTQIKHDIHSALSKMCTQ